MSKDLVSGADSDVAHYFRSGDAPGGHKAGRDSP